MASPIQKFLNANKVEKGSEFTHTSLNGGSYYIQAMDMDKFNELYATAIENGESLSLTEKHREISPILVDLDFRQNTADRLYTEQQVKEFVKLLSSEIEKYVEVDSTQLKFYVMEKPEPRDNKGKGFKDGIHIVCPDIVTAPEVQFIIRENILKNGMNQVFGNTFTNKYDDIYDADVIAKNNWFMYGSKKPDEAYPWTLTKIYGNELNEIDCEHTDDELISVLSIRNKFDALNVKADKMEEVQEYKNKTTKKPAENKPTTAVAMPPPSLDIVGKLVSLLNADRADSRTSWIEVGLCLHNIDYQLLGLWIEFSKQSAKFCDGECEKIWASFTKREGGLSIGTLHKWAKEDSPDKYKEIMEEDLSTLIYQSRNESHYDIARVVHQMYKDKYVCCFVDNKQYWYEFKNHRWYAEDKASSLSIRISTEVFKKYNTAAARFHNKAATTENEGEQSIYTETAKKLSSLAIKLKNGPFKSHVINECAHMFRVTPDSFLDKLNSISHLIGFDNGVYDLKERCFRDGRPEDFITFSTGYDFVDEDASVRQEIMQFIDSIMPTKELIEYLLFTLAYILDGNKYLEQAWFWTGTGRNGKGTLASLLSHTLRSGHYYVESDVSVLTTVRKNASGATSELMRLQNRRCAVFSESSDDSTETIKVKMLKQIVGRDLIQGREVYGRTTEFRPTFSIIFQVNEMPKLSKVESNLLEKINVIRFPFHFVDDPMEGTNQRKIDRRIKDKFNDDIRYRQQFMRILVDCYNRYDIINKTAMKVPDDVSKENNDYFDDNNEIGGWLKEKIVNTNDRNDRYTTTELFNLYKMDNHGSTLNPTSFGKLMTFNKYEQKKSNGVRYYTCIKHADDLPSAVKKSYNIRDDYD